MPCNIGYKSYATIKIPAPEPQTFTNNAMAPDIDADLLEKLGQEDTQFLEWAQELNTKPLLEEALKRALAKVNTGGLVFIVSYAGELEAKGSFTSATEKNRLSAAAAEVSARWQFEILGIVAELLNYTVRITHKGGEFILEAEEEDKTHPCDYIKVSKKGGDATIVFEHFKSRDALKLETAQVLVLANDLGIKMALGKSELTEGDPLPNENRLRHRHDHGHSPDHSH